MEVDTKARLGIALMIGGATLFIGGVVQAFGWGVKESASLFWNVSLPLLIGGLTVGSALFITGNILRYNIKKEEVSAFISTQCGKAYQSVFAKQQSANDSKL